MHKGIAAIATTAGARTISDTSSCLRTLGTHSTGTLHRHCFATTTSPYCSVMEEQAQALLATLRKSSASADAKLTAFNKLKSDIKHLRVPEASQAVIFECIVFAVSSQTSPTLVAAGFSTLAHLVKRLNLQDQTAIISTQTTKLLPILLDRLGDSREANRNAAVQTFADLWSYNHEAVDRTIKEGALSGNNARAKEMAMLWVVKVRMTLSSSSTLPTLTSSDRCIASRVYSSERLSPF